MASTGELVCLGDTFYEAILQPCFRSDIPFKEKYFLLSNGEMRSKVELLKQLPMLYEKGYTFLPQKEHNNSGTETEIRLLPCTRPDETKNPTYSIICAAGQSTW
jgi:carbamoyl-phosphate synthase large subunit